jgi:hypothetical protein
MSNWRGWTESRAQRGLVVLTDESFRCARGKASASVAVRTFRQTARRNVSSDGRDQRLVADRLLDRQRFGREAVRLSS